MDCPTQKIHKNKSPTNKNNFTIILFVVFFSNTHKHTSSATTVLSSATLHTYRGQFDWQNIVFINIYEAGETNLLPMKSHVTIKYSSISMTSYWDFHT